MEEIVPPPTDSGSGFEPVTVRQFTVFLENRVGRLTLLVRALEESTKVVGLSIEESADVALARVICASSDAGRALLQSKGFRFGETEVIIVCLSKNSEHPLIDITSVLLSAEINIHSAHALLVCPFGPAMVIYCDESILAAQLLMRKGYRMIGESDFNNPPADPTGNGNA